MLNRIVMRALKVKLINAYHTEVVKDVWNQIVMRALKVKLINAYHTEAENDVRIVLRGLIVAVVQLHMMDIVLRVSKNYFQTTNVVKLYIDIPKK